jgi:hypothetical protein
MSIVESTTRRLVLTSGSTSLILDRDTNKAALQRKMLFWKLKPIETALSEIREVIVDKAVDRASGIEMFSTMVVTSTGTAWALPASNKTDADNNAAAIRGFLELT